MVEEIELYKKRRIKLSRMLDDFLSAPIPPSLNHIRDMVQSMHVYEKEEDWDNMASAMIMSVIIKIIKTGNYQALAFLVDNQNNNDESKKHYNKSYADLVNAISRVSDNNEPKRIE